MNNNDLVKCTDSDDHLQIWNYVDCDNSSPEDIKQKRGVVTDMEGNVVSSSFGYTEEYDVTDEHLIKERIEEISQWKFFYSIEATLLRLFYFHDQWYLSTHKKLSAFKSRWSCKETFGELFVQGLEEMFEKPKEEVLEWFESQLDPSTQYYFLMRSNQQNRIVCHTHHIRRKEKIIYMGSKTATTPFVFHEKNTESDHVLDVFENPHVVDQPISSVEDVLAIVKKVSPFEYQGIIGFHLETLQSVKIMNSDYRRYYQIRGNNPNLRFRYLELRKNPDQVKLLYVLYPKYTVLFDEYEATLFEIAKMIYQFYISRYIKSQYVTLPKEEYLLMQRCHRWYLEDRQNNRIFAQKILEFMGDEPPIHLYKMIRRFHLESAQHETYPVNPHPHYFVKPDVIPMKKIHAIPIYSKQKNKAFLNMHQT